MGRTSDRHRPGSPNPVLLGVAGLLALTLLGAVALRDGGGPAPTAALPADAAAPALSRELRFEDRADRSVLVTLAGSGEVVGVLPPEGDAFVRGVLRALARERRGWEVGSGPPFRLSRWPDDRLTLDDPATGRRIELGAFGPTNAGAFARLLDAAPAAGGPS